ncbi:M15 family metallopeptidase [Promicromonospora umidemergens]|uniref:M15 family metallopeptidase n=1 Tax=Promicromonospora umidemergens TaxID=629679 RepID=UPI0020A50FDD|nr:M15 family metallopeptidase [Promicromonospora umidemergens]
MTSTNTMPAVDPSGMKAGATARDRREAKGRRRRILRVVAATLAVVLVLGGGGVAWWVTSETDALSSQVTAAKRLMETSDGKVAKQTTRVGLSAQIAEANSVLDESVLTRLTTGTADARQSLGAATDAVEGSMVEFGRDEVEAARKSLVAAQGQAEKVYAATEGLGVDDGTRERLQSALDSMATADAAASTSVDGEDLAALEQAVNDLSTNRSVVTVATTALVDAQDAITCPAPDQTWDPDSGKVPESALAEIPWAPTHFVRADVLDSLVKLDEAYQKAFGEHLTINSSYRSYKSQASIYDPSSPIAAPPGCSNHGLALAVDIGGGVETFGTEQYEWLKDNAETYSWTHPAFAEPDGRVPEPWHWESVLARSGA